MSAKRPKRKTLTKTQLENLQNCIAESELPKEAYELLSHIDPQTISAYLDTKIRKWLTKYEAVYGKQE